MILIVAGTSYFCLYIQFSCSTVFRHVFYLLLHQSVHFSIHHAESCLIKFDDNMLEQLTRDYLAIWKLLIVIILLAIIILLAWQIFLLFPGKQEVIDFHLHYQMLIQFLYDLVLDSWIWIDGSLESEELLPSIRNIINILCLNYIIYKYTKQTVLCSQISAHKVSK